MAAPTFGFDPTTGAMTTSTTGWIIDPMTGKLVPPPGAATPQPSQVTPQGTIAPYQPGPGNPMGGGAGGVSASPGGVSASPGGVASQGRSGPSYAGLGGGSTTNGVDIGSMGRVGMSLGSMIPGIGPAVSLANMGLHGYNVNNVDNALHESDLPGLSIGQTIGGVIGLNGYGDGSNRSIAQAVAAAGGNTQSAGSPGFSPGAASGDAGIAADGHAAGVAAASAGMGGGIGQSNGGGGEY